MPFDSVAVNWGCCLEPGPVQLCFMNSRSVRSLTPHGFQLTHRPQMFGGGVGFFTRGDLPPKTADAPTYSTFINIVISVAIPSKSFVVVFVYHTPGSCSWPFLDDFLFFFLTSS